MGYTNTFDDILPISSDNIKELSKSRKQQPLTKGILYEELDDGYGHPVLKKISDNSVVVGGAIMALEQLSGITNTWKPSTLNTIYNLNTTVSAGASDLDSRIILFGVGMGGSQLDFGNIIDPDIKARNIPDQIPFRYNSVLTGSDADKYWFKMAEADGVNYKWLLKEMEADPVIRTLWKDSVEEDVDGTEVTEEIYDSPRTDKLCSFIEYRLKFSAEDVHEYFKAIGELDMARYNCIGLYTGNKVTLPDGGVDYVNVRLFSYVTFNNKDVSNKTVSTYRYRIFGLV